MLLLSADVHELEAQDYSLQNQTNFLTQSPKDRQF